MTAPCAAWVSPGTTSTSARSSPRGRSRSTSRPWTCGCRWASVKLFGFGSAALKTPEALAGTLAVPLLYAAVAPVFGVRRRGLSLGARARGAADRGNHRAQRHDGRGDDGADRARAGVAGASRTRRAHRVAAGGRRGAWDRLRREAAGVGRGAAGAGADRLAGAAGHASPPPRATGAGGSRVRSGCACVADRDAGFPRARPAVGRYGSTNGSAWNSSFVFNGLDRLEGKSLEGAQVAYQPSHHYPEATQVERDAIPILPPSPTRLFDRVGPLSGERLGLEVLVGLLLGGAALGALLWERRTRRREATATDAAPNGPPVQQRLRLALLAGLMLWLLTGIALFSDMSRLHPRYTEAFTPAVAATLGIGLAWATERRGRNRLLALSVTLLVAALYAERLLFGTSTVWWITTAGAVSALALAWSGFPRRDTLRAGVTALALVCILAIPLWASLNAVRENVSDTNPLGILHHDELAPLSAYLRAHQGSAYYEVAFDSGTKMGELVERDARPILVLTTLEGHVFTSLARLRALVAAGKVRYAFLDEGCGPQSPPTDPDCSAPARWVSEHGTDVSRQAGMPRPGMLWRLPEAHPPSPHGGSRSFPSGA